MNESWLGGIWHRQQRRIDLQILWPVCKKQANDIEHAKALFACHAFNDNAWLILGDEGIKKVIDELQ